LDNKAPDAFRTISEVADELDLPQHVLRFWESRFREIKPMKRGGGRRYYRPEDVDLLRGIKHLLYGEGYTIRGVQRILREQSVGFVQAVWQEGAPQPPHISGDEDSGDEAHEAPEVVDDADALEEPRGESRGLRERLTSLIGRDLGDRNETPGDRREPPLHGAPVPRIDPADRAIFDVDAPRMAQPAATPPPMRAAPVAATPSGPAGGVSRDHIHRLHAALHELVECRKLIDGALAPEK
jgi:DNA-binding transcriptional MerR regulator